MTEDFTSLVRVIAKNVRYHRCKCGMTMDDLAKASGLARMTVSDIEHGTTDPRLKSLTKIAIALDVSCLDLISDK